MILRNANVHVLLDSFGSTVFERERSGFHCTVVSCYYDTVDIRKKY